jgi:tRNA threonylcarbamoyladenosine biosynthesis protein TsaE
MTAVGEAALQDAARALGRVAAPGLVVPLLGPMGAGKTTFTRALAEGLGVRRPDRVRSPTFNVCLVHDGSIPLVHIDLFRFGGLSDGESARPAFEALGLHALLDDVARGAPGDVAASVVVIEWADLLWPALVGGEGDLDVAHLWIRLHRGDDPTVRDLEAGATEAATRGVVSAWRNAIDGR